MAATWDIQGKAANLAQFSGLQAITLIAVTMAWLQFPQNHKQCLKLQGRVQVLRHLLQLPALIQHSEMKELVTKAILEADALVESYSRSTAWSRLRRGRSMAIQLRDMRNAIDSYCGMIIVVNASLPMDMILQPNPCPPDVRIQVKDDGPDGVLSATVGTDPYIHCLDIDQEGT